MIKDNIIDFDEGDIAVGFDLNTLIFTEIKPKQEKGTILHSKSDIKMSKRIIIQATIEEFQELKNKLNKLLQNVYADTKIKFKEYEFLALIYDESIINIIRCIDIAMYGFQIGIVV